MDLKLFEKSESFIELSHHQFLFTDDKRVPLSKETIIYSKKMLSNIESKTGVRIKWDQFYLVISNDDIIKYLRPSQLSNREGLMSEMWEGRDEWVYLKLWIWTGDGGIGAYYKCDRGFGLMEASNDFIKKVGKNINRY